MKQNKQALEAWKHGVPLGYAGLAFADKQNRQRYHKARREGSHSSIEISLEMDLVARLFDGELQAIGIEGGSDPRPDFIPQYYFSKTAEINWDEETVADFSKKFHQVRVRGPREVVHEPWMKPTVVDPRLIRGEWEKAAEALPSEAASSDNPPNEAELESADEAPPSEQEPSDEPPIQRERGSADKMLPGKPTPEKLEGAFSLPRGRGRPSKELEIERAIDILLRRGVDLAKMPRPKAYGTVRECAASELKSDTKIGFTDPVIQRFLFRRFGARR